MKPYLKLLPAIAWFILTIILFTLPGKDLPQIGWMVNLPIDKIVHTFLFSVLVTLFFWGIVSTKPGITNKRTLVLIAISALLYGITIEFIQKYWIPNRSFDIWDIVADGVGSFLPIFFIEAIKKIFKIEVAEV